MLPRLNSQPARGGGGKPGSGPAGLRAAAAAEQQPRRDVEGWRRRRCTRPRSGAAARDPQVGVRPALLGLKRFAAHLRPDLLGREGPRPHQLFLLLDSNRTEFRSQITGAEASILLSATSESSSLSLSLRGQASSCAPHLQLAAATVALVPLAPLRDPGSGTSTTLLSCLKLCLSFSSTALVPLLMLLE